MIITERQKLEERIKEYKSIIGSLYEEINVYEGWLKEAENELANLNDENNDSLVFRHCLEDVDYDS